MRKRSIAVTGALAAIALGAAAAQPGSTESAPQDGRTRQYVVLYGEAAAPAAARAAIAASGGTIVRENRAVGLATVESTAGAFASEVRSASAIAGVARDTPIGTAGPAQTRDRFAEERLLDERAASRGTARALADPPGDPLLGIEPFAPLQWDMAMIGATALESHNVQPGDPGVRVGIIDTGVDGTHPDIAPNFDATLSRNFTTDIPLIDGPCEDEPDASCEDAANVDENSHGTHVASTVGSPVNGLGMAGVAPKVTLVNLRAGQDSGYFFLQASVDALTYAADNGIDVVNMSYYIDPWLYNCTANPADSPEAQLEQRTIIEATQRALHYATDHGVTLVAALGNQLTNIDNPTFDGTSPDFPPGAAYPRTVDNSCLSLPTEGDNVISVAALGPTTAKADYSNWGLVANDVSAPGGWFRDYLGTIRNRTPENLILAAYPENVARANDELDEDGVPTTPFVLRDCEDGGGSCAYYQYIQGTSMAAPHAAGVAALIVSEQGGADAVHGGLTLNPARVESVLEATAQDHPCPQPRLFKYDAAGRPPAYNAFCSGPPERNAFYGHGIVNALAAVIGD